MIIFLSQRWYSDAPCCLLGAAELPFFPRPYQSLTARQSLTSDLEAAASRPGSSCLTSDLEAATASIRRCAPTILRLATAFAMVIGTILLVVWDVVFRVGFATYRAEDVRPGHSRSRHAAESDARRPKHGNQIIVSGIDLRAVPAEGMMRGTMCQGETQHADVGRRREETSGEVHVVGCRRG